MKKAKSILWLLAALLVASCSEEALLVEEEAVADIEAGKLITVPLNLEVADMAPATPAAKTRTGIDDPVADNGVSSVIYNAWVLQYEGTATTAPLVNWYYIEDYQHDRTAKLVVSDKTNTIVILANTFDPLMSFALGETMNKLIETPKGIVSQSDLFSATIAATPGEGFPDNADYHLYMNGACTPASIRGASDIPTITLKRNIAKVVFNVTVADDANVHLVNLLACSVPNKSFYFTNRHAAVPLSTTAFPANSDITWRTFNKPASATTSGNTTTYVYYLPANIRGTRTTYTDDKLKTFAPPTAATYLKLLTYSMQGSLKMPYSYSFYLGANMNTDYNLKPNCVYTYDITFNAPGDPQVDFRIESGATLDYTKWERANCYICNPPPFDLQTYGEDDKRSIRQFRIPVDRIDEFWGTELPEPDAYGKWKYEGDNERSNCLLESKPWVAKLIWSDFDPTPYPDFKISKAAGSGKNDYFTVDVPYGLTGNALVGVKMSSGSGTDWLWTWHLWITTYDPEPCKQYNRGGTVNVRNGSVDSYNRTSAGSVFRMQRWIGASYFGNDPKAMFYQYGRKDPLPRRDRTVWVFGEDGNVTTRTLGVTKTQADVEASGLNAVVYGMRNPLEFINGQGYTSGNNTQPWCIGNKYNPSTYDGQIMWNDPYARYNEYYTARQKSIFDPAPPGWIVSQGVLRNDGTGHRMTPVLSAQTGYGQLSQWVDVPVSATNATAGPLGSSQCRTWAFPVYCSLYRPK